LGILGDFDVDGDAIRSRHRRVGLFELTRNPNVCHAILGADQDGLGRGHEGRSELWDTASGGESVELLDERLPTRRRELVESEYIREAPMITVATIDAFRIHHD
jgi:hypothetical protein